MKVKQEKDSVYDEDIDKTLSDDVWVERFLEWHGGNIEKTVDGLLFSLKTQKKHKIREVSVDDFPNQFKECLFFHGLDNLGRKVLHSRLKMVPLEKEKRDMVMQFTTLMYFKAEETKEKNGYIVINDYNGMSLTSFDLDLVNCLLQTKDIFPAAAAMFITINVPWVLKASYNAIKYALPKEHTRGMAVISEKDLKENVVSAENLPQFLGGRSI